MEVRRQMTLLMKRIRDFSNQEELQSILVYENEFFSVIGSDYCISPMNDRQSVAILSRDVGSMRDSVENVVKSGVWYGAKSHDEKLLEHRYVLEILKQMHLEGTVHKRVSHLTEFQIFRVELARALFANPKVIVCNNPFYSEDSVFRMRMLSELHRVQKMTGVSIVYVTESASEVMRISDRMAIIHEGRIQQSDTPENIYRHPVSCYVAKTVGMNNVLEGYVTTYQGKRLLVTESGYMKPENGLEDFQENELIYLAVRPEHIRFQVEQPERIHIRGRLREYRFGGAYYEAHVKLADGQEIVSLVTQQQYAPGELLYLNCKESDMVLIKSTGNSIYSEIEKLSKQVGNSLSVSE